MKLKTTSALVTALLLTSVSVYAKPHRDLNDIRQNAAQAEYPNKANRNQSSHSNQSNNGHQRGNAHGNNPANANPNRGNHDYPQADNHNSGGHNEQHNQPRRHRDYDRGHGRDDNRSHTNVGIWITPSVQAYEQYQPMPVQTTVYYGNQGHGHEHRDWNSYAPRYVVQDWRHHHQLYEPPHGTRWMMSVNGDFVLASILTGVIYSIIH